MDEFKDYSTTITVERYYCIIEGDAYKATIVENATIAKRYDWMNTIHYVTDDFFRKVRSGYITLITEGEYLIKKVK